jgi:hypothetical protein
MVLFLALTRVPLVARLLLTRIVKRFTISRQIFIVVVPEPLQTLKQSQVTHFSLAKLHNFAIVSFRSKKLKKKICIYVCAGQP